jgi:hypothetical protein
MMINREALGYWAPAFAGVTAENGETMASDSEAVSSKSVHPPATHSAVTTRLS